VMRNRWPNVFGMRPLCGKTVFVAIPVLLMKRLATIGWFHNSPRDEFL